MCFVVKILPSEIPFSVVNSFPFTGAILAGGRSSRMGRDKAFLSLDGRPLVARQADLLRGAGCAEMLISGRPGIDYGVPAARLVYDSVEDAGPLAGLVAALAASRHPWLLVLAVDLPHINNAFLRTLLSVGAGRTGIVPRTSLGWEPLAGLYPRTLLPAAEQALRSGHCSLQSLLDQAALAGTVTPLPVPPGDHGLFANWNSPGDLSSAS